MKFAAIPALAVLMMGSAAAAQEAAPPPPAASQPAPEAPAAQQNYSDAQVDNFAQAVLKVQEIQGDATLEQEAKQTAMVAAVQESGLDPQTYNSMSQAAQQDPQLLERIQLAVAARTGQPTNQ